MRSLLVLSCLFAAATIVRGNVMEDYLKYLEPYITPCLDQFQLKEEDVNNVQNVAKMSAEGLERMACMRACVMKDMGALDGQLELVMEPVFKMIEAVHENKPDEIAKVKVIATECEEKLKAETAECQRASKYAECYIQRMMEMEEFQ